MKNLSTCVLLFLILSFTTKKAMAQGKEVTLDPVQVTVSIVPLMAHLEAKIAEKQSFTFGGGLAYSAYYQNINGEGNFEGFSTPFLTASFRNYYNRKRVKKDNLRNNSGNYVALLIGYAFDSIVEIDGFGTGKVENNSSSIGPVWGIQRNYASGIHLDVSVGLGYIAYQSTNELIIEDSFTIIGGFEFGFRFNQ